MLAQELLGSHRTGGSEMSWSIAAELHFCNLVQLTAGRARGEGGQLAGRLGRGAPGRSGGEARGTIAPKRGTHHPAGGVVQLACGWQANADLFAVRGQGGGLT